jgi:hypothetical protein
MEKSTARIVTVQPFLQKEKDPGGISFPFTSS